MMSIIEFRPTVFNVILHTELLLSCQVNFELDPKLFKFLEIKELNIKIVNSNL